MRRVWLRGARLLSEARGVLVHRRRGTCLTLTRATRLEARVNLASGRAMGVKCKNELRVMPGALRRSLKKQGLWRRAVDFLPD